MAVRGYAKWKPKDDALYWVARTRLVIDAYEDYWPLSVRQIFYRLVADHGYDKTEAAYGRLTGLLSRARRAGMLPWKAIRDGGLGRTIAANYFEGPDHFARSMRHAAAEMKLNRQQGQDKEVELWCEAGGMVPILQGIAAPYSARVNTGGGYDSVTAKHNLAVRVAERAKTGLRTVVLHVGDFDGSGEDMCEVLREDAQHMVVPQVARAAARNHWKADLPDFVERWRDGNQDLDSSVARWALEFLEIERVALTGEQVIERNVETAPPKKSDSRTAEFLRRNKWVADELGTTQISAQLEALTPPDLNNLISTAIADHLDLGIYNKVLEREEQAREELLERLGDLGAE